MRSMLKVVMCVALVAVVASSVGCGARMGKYDLRVAMDPSLTKGSGGAPPVTVNIVGVNETSRELWNRKNMQEYWTPGDSLRADAEQRYAYVMQFGPGRPDELVLRRDDPMWAKWREVGATHLFVLADLPGSYEAQPGSADPRRRELPLDTRRWKDSVIDIELQRSSVLVKTQILPERK